MERWKAILLGLAMLALFLLAGYLEDPADYESVPIPVVERVYWENAR